MKNPIAVIMSGNDSDMAETIPQLESSPLNEIPKGLRSGSVASLCCGRSLILMRGAAFCVFSLLRFVWGITGILLNN